MARGGSTPRQRWSPERIVDAVRRFDAEHGRLPTVKDWRRVTPDNPDASTVGRHFGSWAAMVEAAGFVPSRMAWTEQSIADAIRAWSERVGRSPTATDWARRDADGRWPASHTVQARFGTFDAAVRVAGCEPARVQWDCEKVVAAIRAFAEDHGRRPQRAELRLANGLPGVDMVNGLFGSVATAFAAAGHPLPEHREWTRGEMLEAITVFAAEHDRAPTWAEWKRASKTHPQADAVSREFGTWAAAIEAAGLRPAGRRFDRAEITAVMRAWIIEHGRAPKPAEWRPDPRRGLPTMSAIRRQFTSWERAVAAAAEGLDLPGLAPAEREVYQHAERWVPRGTWDRERVIDALQDWACEFGESPMTQEFSASGAVWLASPYRERAERWALEHPRWPSSAAVRTYFATWGEALEAAGLPVPHPRPVFDESLAERVGSALRMHAAGHSRSTIAHQLGVTVSTVDNYLRAGLCSECGAPVVSRDARRCVMCSAAERLEPRFSPKQIVALMHDWERETDARPLEFEWQPTSDQRTRWGRDYPRWPSAHMAVRAFGSWRAALEAAEQPVWRQEWTPERIIAALRRFGELHGRAPQSADLAGAPELWPSATTVRRYFGSIPAGLEAAGFVVREQRVWTREDVVTYFRAFAAEHGHPPSYRDLAAASSAEQPSGGVVYGLFGSWNEALRAADQRPRLNAWTAASALEALCAFAAEHDRLPTGADLGPRANPPTPSLPLLSRHFGGLRRALVLAGLGAQRRHWTMQEVLVAVRRHADQHGAPPRQIDWSSPDPDEQRPTSRQVAGLFGTWGAGLRAAGYTPAPGRKRVVAERR